MTLDEHWDVHLVSIREHAHQLLWWAYLDIRGRINSGSQEPDITGLLCVAMQARIDSPETPGKYMRYTIGDQSPVSPAGELGNARLRLDISVRRTGIRPQLVYVFEAKRLRTGSYTIGKYTGQEGMGDFISCRYAPNCPEGGLIGFYQDRDEPYWTQELHRALEEDQAQDRPNLAIQEKLSPMLLPTKVTALRSVHTRSDGTRITLVHVFFDCR